jgi:hypothetical protein
MPDRPAQLLEIARSLAGDDPEFQAVRGPGLGDRSTQSFMEELRRSATVAFGIDCSEKRLCGSTAFAADFFFPEECTVVEVALGLPNPASEFEKDILKAIMAQDDGYAVTRLFFISRPGAIKKCKQPGRSALKEWAKVKHNLAIEVHELAGEPRIRRRRRRALG